MRLKILVFGPLADAVGGRLVHLDVPETPPLDGAGVLRLIGAAHPVLRPLLPASRLAINARFASPADTVTPADELALIGMVSGG